MALNSVLVSVVTNLFEEICHFLLSSIFLPLSLVNIYLLISRIYVWCIGEVNLTQYWLDIVKYVVFQFLTTICITRKHVLYYCGSKNKASNQNKTPQQ